MNAAEKSELSSFLTIAQGWISGYRFPQVQNPENDPASEFTTFSALNQALEGCKRCPLGESRNALVRGQGPEGHSPVLVVGEAPGSEEESNALSFSGRAGALLDKMLAAIGLSRTENCYLTHIVKCRPPEDRKSTGEEAAFCRANLDCEIALVQPFMILALGKGAAETLLGTDEDIRALRGRIFEYSGIPLMATFNPGDLLLEETLKRPVWEDLKIFKSELDRMLAR